MRQVLLILWIVLLFIAVWLQFQYKNANYPDTWKWRLVLFFSGFLFASFSSVFLPAGTTIENLLITILLGGTFGGLIFSYASPHNMKGFYPKQPKSEQGYGEEGSSSAGIDSEN